MDNLSDANLVRLFNENRIFDFFQLTVLRADTTAGTVEVEFNLDNKYSNPTGDIQGGIVSGMADDTMAFAFIFQNRFKKRPPTVELKTNFLYPTKPGKVLGYGKVVKSGKNLVFLECQLKQNDRTIVTATSTCVSVDMPKMNFNKLMGEKNEK